MSPPRFEGRITLGNIITVGVQAVVLIAFFVGLNYRVDAAQVSIAELKTWEITANITMGEVENRLTTAEVNQKNGADRGTALASDVKDIKGTLSLLLQQTAALNAKLGDRAGQP